MNQEFFTIFKNAFPDLLFKKFGKRMTEDDGKLFKTIITRLIQSIMPYDAFDMFNDKIVLKGGKLYNVPGILLIIGIKYTPLINKILNMCSDLDIKVEFDKKIDGELFSKYFIETVACVSFLQHEINRLNIKYEHIIKANTESVYMRFIRASIFISFKIMQNAYNVGRNKNINLTFEIATHFMNLDDGDYRLIESTSEMNEEFKRSSNADDYLYYIECHEFSTELNESAIYFKKLFKGE